MLSAGSSSHSQDPHGLKTVGVLYMRHRTTDRYRTAPGRTAEQGIGVEVCDDTHGIGRPIECAQGDAC